MIDPLGMGTNAVLKADTIEGVWRSSITIASFAVSIWGHRNAGKRTGSTLRMEASTRTHLTSTCLGLSQAITTARSCGRARAMSSGGSISTWWHLFEVRRILFAPVNTTPPTTTGPPTPLATIATPSTIRDDLPNPAPERMKVRRSA